jgi:hypothetical protein
MSATQLAALARSSDPHTMLRRFLTLDAAVTGVNGLAYLTAAGPLGRFLGADSGLLLVLGAFLTVYAAAGGLLAARSTPAAPLVRAVVEGNLAWAALSFAALGLWRSPTTAGGVWTVLQALTVGAFAFLRYAALRSRQGSSE